MSAAAAVQAPWFGELLGWRRDDQVHEWWALYAGREYRLRQLGREVTGGRPGWYLTRHPDDEEQDGGHVGPWTGRTLQTARQLAEVWAVLEAADRIRYNDAPSFLTVMNNGARCSHSWQPDAARVAGPRAGPDRHSGRPAAGSRAVHPRPACRYGRTTLLAQRRGRGPELAGAGHRQRSPYRPAWPGNVSRYEARPLLRRSRRPDRLGGGPG
jgi:hypothetical protein